MKSTIRPVSLFAAIATAGLLAASTANAATSPSKITVFNTTKPTHTLQATAKSWRDPAFGDMGWTHASGWGLFRAKAGDIVTITADAGNPGIHPAVSVWFRGKQDTALNKYVPDHFYPQNANQYVYAAKNEQTGEALGTISMQIAAYGYDQDGNSRVLLLNGKKDGTPGVLELSFKAKKTGVYLFVLGALNPGAGVDVAPFNDIMTKVTVTAP